MRDRPWRAARRALLSIAAVQLAAMAFGPDVAGAARGAWLDLVPLLAPLCSSGANGSNGPSLTAGAPMAGLLAATALHGLHAIAWLAAGGGAAALIARLGAFATRKTAASPRRWKRPSL